MKKRYCIVGAGVRCRAMFVLRLTKPYADTVDFVGVYDNNKLRSKHFQDYVGQGLTIYDDFDKMLDTEKPDAVIVTTKDNTHHEYVVRALEKGYDVICEKPISNTFERCLAIRDAEKKSGKKVITTFNCRFMPYFLEIKKLIKSGVIGRPLHVSLDHFLNYQGGGNYFHRWHRYMENSQGMLLHKSTHDFDIVNWFLEDEPKKVTAVANRVFYGDAGTSYGERCYTCTKTDCPARKETSEFLKEFYIDNEHEDGSIIDTCSFDKRTDICDNYSVSVEYKGGAILSYSLNLFSIDQGHRFSITGTKGMIRFYTGHRAEGEEHTHSVIKVLFPNGKTEVIKIPMINDDHGGGDAKLIHAMFSGEEFNDEFNQQAGSYDGVVSAMIGIGANESIKTGKVIDLTEQLNQLK